MQGGLIVVSKHCPRDSAPTGLKVTALVNLLTEVAVIILDFLFLTFSLSLFFFQTSSAVKMSFHILVTLNSLPFVHNEMYVCAGVCVYLRMHACVLMTL